MILQCNGDNIKNSYWYHESNKTYYSKYKSEIWYQYIPWLISVWAIKYKEKAYLKQKMIFLQQIVLLMLTLTAFLLNWSIQVEIYYQITLLQYRAKSTGTEIAKNVCNGR